MVNSTIIAKDVMKLSYGRIEDCCPITAIQEAKNPLQVRLWSYCAIFFDHFGEHNSHDERDKDHSPHLKRMALSVLLCRYEYASAT